MPGSWPELLLLQTLAIARVGPGFVALILLKEPGGHGAVPDVYMGQKS